jgi:dolichol-phosphate mannosyltransferase
MKISMILPTYNERENINILIPSLETFFRRKKINHEIIVVDDSSPDGTADAARDMNRQYKNIRVIERKTKAGIGSAIRTGYNAGNGSILLSMDSDLSFNVSDIEKILSKFNEGYDMVVGNRHSKGGHYKATEKNIKVKRIISKYGNKMTRFIVGLDLRDFSANFRGVRKDVWKKLETKDSTNSILLEMIVSAKSKGYNVGEVPVEFSERRYGVSKLNLSREAPKFLAKALVFRLRYLVKWT